MLSALQLVFAGGICIPPEILAREQPSAQQPDGKQPAATRPIVSPADFGRTERPVDVLSLMMQGKAIKAICRVLNLAEPTVKSHVIAILKALEPLPLAILYQLALFQDSIKHRTELHRIHWFV
jgi:DNA-binding NarL/FixJ family response regulator